jgi:hypothetical protein
MKAPPVKLTRFLPNFTGVPSPTEIKILGFERKFHSTNHWQRHWTVIKRVPVSVPVVAVIVAVPAAGKVALPLAEFMLTADVLLEVQVTALVAPTAVKVVLGAPTL